MKKIIAEHKSRENRGTEDQGNLNESEKKEINTMNNANIEDEAVLD